MSAFVLVPTVFWKGYSTIDFGTLSVGIEYNATNAARSDYAAITNGTDTLDFTHSAALTFPTSFAANGAGIWTKWDDAILTADPTYENYLQLWTGADASTDTQKTLVAAYGDCTANGDDIKFAGGGIDDGFAEVIGLYDDQYSDVFWRIVLNNYTGLLIEEHNLYEVMIGHIVPLPDGYVREERAIQRVHYGGRVGVRAFGDASWSGIYSHAPRHSFEIQMEGLVESDRNIWRDIFRYGRGVFPVLVVEDSSDKTTWTKCKMTRLFIEEDTKMYNLTIEFDEI